MQGHPQASTSLPSTYANHQGSKILSSGNKNPETIALARGKSTPGLVESSGKIPLEAMMITRHHTLPAGLPKQSPSSADEETHDENSMETGENAHAETTVER